MSVANAIEAGTCGRRQSSWAIEGANAPRAHHVRYLNNVFRKWSTFEALANTVVWWKLLGKGYDRVGGPPWASSHEANR